MSYLKAISGNFLFWLILFFFIRLIGITNPPLEISHNWRQVTGLMVSRNFLEVDNNILYPRVDDTNGETGIIGMEFPSLNYLVYLLSAVLGYQYWYGRLINLIISSVGLWFYYLLVKEYFSPRIALFSSLVLTTSIWFAFSRKMMPDTYSVSLVMIAIYGGAKFLKEGKIYHLLLYVLFALLGILSKIPSIIFLSLFIVPIFSKEITIRKKIVWSIVTIVVLAVVCGWYFVWNVHLANVYHNWYNTGNDLITGTKAIFSHWDEIAKSFYFFAFQGYIFFTLLICALVVIWNKWSSTQLFGLLLFALTFVVYIFKSGRFYYSNNYYIIPMVPVMALIVGYFLSIIRYNWLAVSLLSIGMVEGVLNQQHDFFIKPRECYKMSLEQIADKVCGRSDLIVINGGPDPQELYLSHRKGWCCSTDLLNDKSYITNVLSKGCQYVFLDKKLGNIILPYPIIFQNENYSVYRLR